MVMATPHQNLVDSQSCKYNEVVCGGRSDKLILEKFHKLEGNKAYGKCVECNNKLVLPQEFKAIAGMKAMKSWKKLVHKRMSILTFEGLSTTIEASMNVYFTYFCHKIICYSDYTCITVASKMLTSNN